MRKADLKNRILYCCVLAILTLPLIQRYSDFSDERELQGAYVKAIAPRFTFGNWMEGTYQDSALRWINESSGFHKTLVRVRNQIGWELFGFAYANSTIRGTEDYLFDIDNIKAYSGKDFIGEDSLLRRANRLKQLQDVLAEQGITLVVVLAPGKASFYSKYLPNHQREIIGPTNYAVFSSGLKQCGVNLLDFHAWFDTLRNETPYPLFPKCGLHWSRYGALLAADSLIGFVSDKIRQPMPGFVIDRVYMSDSLLDPDFDIGSAMNLYWDVKPPPMAYADFHAGKSSGGIRPRALVVGDSYFWTMPSQQMQETAFKGIDFFYYNRDFFPGAEPSKQVNGEKINLLAEISGCDVIILLCTETNLLRFPWGFDGQALTSMRDPEKNRAEYRRMHIAYIERDIHKDQNWMNIIIADAEKSKINLDTAIRRNAEWVFDWQQNAKAKAAVK